MAKTMIVDMDAATMVLADDEHTIAASRAAIDEIATRVEEELARLGVDGVEVEREYDATGRRSTYDAPEIWEAVCIGQVREIRAAVLGVDSDEQIPSAPIDIETENALLSIGDEFLPACAIAVRDGGPSTAEYVAWLTGQIAEMDRDERDRREAIADMESP